MTTKLRTIARRASIGAFLIVFGVLVYSNWTLRQRYDALYEELQLIRSSPTTAFRVGERLPSLNLADRNGRPVTFNPAGPADSYAVIVDPNCSSCIAALNQIRRSTAPTAVISLLPRRRSAALIASTPPNVPLFFADNLARSGLSGRVSRVPRILRVRRDGVITAICDTLPQCQSP